MGTNQPQNRKLGTFSFDSGHTEADFRNKLEYLTSADLAVFDELGAVPIKDIHSDTYIVLICMSGKGTFKADGTVHEVAAHDLAIGHPNLFVEDVMVSLDFKCLGLVMSPSHFESIFFLGGNNWDAVMAIRQHPVMHLTPDEVERSVFNIGIIRKKLSDTHLPHHKEAVKLLLHSMLYEFYDCLSAKLDLDNINYKYTASETLFKRFTRLLAEKSPCRYEVSYYAKELCVTRKYLSSVCKQQSGKTASELINDMTVNNIRRMLRSTDKTVKEISVEMGFSSLSFFGKYVRRELGVSPREYRQQKN